MRLVIQRVSSGSVTWSEAGELRESSIGRGFVILVGAAGTDEEADVQRLADKVANLRVFPDEHGLSNLSLLDVGGAALLVSQFTLFADLRRGRRPSFLQAGDPGRAAALVDGFAQGLTQRGLEVRTGSFGAHMRVRLENDGPVTLVLSTDEWNPRV